jgi:hypothetical protein
MAQRACVPRRSSRSLPRCVARVLCGALLLAAAPSDAEEKADPFSGTYDVKGITVDQRSGDQRVIQGHVVLTKRKDVWAAAAELETDFPTHGGPVRTDVIGTGEGRLEGSVLKGSAQTQLVIQTVPGVDTDFAFIPRAVGPRVVSSWSARLERDGTLVVELSNQGAEGEAYSPSRTTLKGVRVAMPQDKSATP